MLQSPPRVPPVSPARRRPRWSVMIPTYNCAHLLPATLESVLAQDPGPRRMQIEVVDDGSTLDDPEAVVTRMGGGRVEFHRQPRNVGHARNFNTCLARSRGRLVHLLHGDDLVLPGFYERLGRAFTEPAVGMSFTRHAFTDESGRILRDGPRVRLGSGILADAPSQVGGRQPIQTPAVVVRRKVYEALGGFDERMESCGEDWEMWARISSRFMVHHEDAILAHYRTRAASLSGESLRSGQNLRDLRRAIRIYSRHFPAEDRERIARQARRQAADWGVYLARKMILKGKFASGLRQLREAYLTIMDSDGGTAGPSPGS